MYPIKPYQCTVQNETCLLGVFSDTEKNWPQCYKTFSCLTKLSMTFILLINVKMPICVGISPFISIMLQL